MNIFFGNFTESDTQIVLDESESTHIVKVLRKNVNDHIQITNGNGLLVDAELIEAHPKHCVLVIKHTYEIAPQSHKQHLHIAIAPTKNMDRFEFFVEKACELGVAEITPIICMRSERKEIKIERIQKIIRSACLQSKELNFPILHEAMSFKNFIKTNASIQKYMCHCEGERSALVQVDTTIKAIVLVGPEGDFTTEEIQIAANENMQFIDLGTKRLRTETAGIYIASYFYSKR